MNNSILKSQKFFIILSVLFVVTGILIMVWPNVSLDMVGKGAAIAMLVIGLTHVIIYFTKDHLQTIIEMDLTVGVVFASFGAFMLMHSDFVSMAIPFAVGILLLIGAMTKIQYSIDMKRMKVQRWATLIFFALILAAVGVVLLYNPFKEQTLIYVIAVSLILDGTLNIISVLFIAHRIKKINRGMVPMTVRAKNTDGSEVVDTPEDAAGSYSGAAAPSYDDPDDNPGNDRREEEDKDLFEPEKKRFLHLPARRDK